MSLLGAIGAEARGRSSYVLQLAALLWGVLREGALPSTWRRTLRADFRTILTRVVGGSLGTIAVTAFIVGLGLVFEALYWLRTAGQQDQIGRILVIVLFREITPLLVGIILLGRGGTAADCRTRHADGRRRGHDPAGRGNRHLRLSCAAPRHGVCAGRLYPGRGVRRAVLDQRLCDWQRFRGGEYVDLRLP